jgi:cytidine deaminase
MQDTSGSSGSLDRQTAETLLRRAREARRHAYAPYSHFPVGAALLAETGEVFTGCNVENASYGLTTCAERVAIGKAISEGVNSFRAIAVVGPEDTPPCPPCGSCRQVLHEFGPNLLVITPGDEHGADAPVVRTMSELLPGAFDNGWLKRGERRP